MTRHAVGQCVCPGDADWPAFAPSWAECARFEPFGDGHLDVVFVKSWSIPSSFRDAEDFEVVRVEQAATIRDGSTEPVFTDPTVAVGPEGIWSDSRRDTASMLRQIADVLDPTNGAAP